MKWLLHRIFWQNFPRKIVALLSAIVIWLLVNESITITRTLPDVAIRVINIPPHKTVVGLLPSGLLNKKTSVTITGIKAAVSELKASDIEILINAEGKNESWMAKIDKKSIVNLSGDWDLKRTITEVTGCDIFIKMSRLAVEEIPVTIKPPTGEPVQGYEFLDVWPKHLVQRVSGPEELVIALKRQGLELTFSLDKVSENDLKAAATQGDEISFFIPTAWKEISIPFRDNALEPLNDPRAKFLRLDFLKQELLPLGEKLPVTLFYPLKYAAHLNPHTTSLNPSELIKEENGLHLLTIPLFVKDVSRLFLDVVRGNIELFIIVTPTTTPLEWSLEFIDEKSLEETFVTLSLERGGEKYAENEELLRSRFRDYKHKLMLYTQESLPLTLEAKLQNSRVLLNL